MPEWFVKKLGRDVGWGRIFTAEGVKKNRRVFKEDRKEDRAVNLLARKNIKVE
jgi:hypothetical protein